MSANKTAKFKIHTVLMKRSDIDDRKMDSCDDEDGDSDSSYQSESGRSDKHTDRKITSNNSGVGQQAGSFGVSGGDESGQSSSEFSMADTMASTS